MRQQSRAKRVAFHRAVWASVVLHVVAGCAILLLLRSLKDEKPQLPGIDTHAASETEVRMHFAEDISITIETPVPTKPPEVSQTVSQATPPTPQIETPVAPQPTQPLVTSRAPATPQMLPPEMLAIIRKPTPQAVAVSIPNAPATSITDTNVKPAVATVNSNTNTSTNAPGAKPAPAIHGALKPEQTVVYILDCSGSMGAAGKLDTARAALISTLKQQPATVRFQVIVYSGSARPLLASHGKGLPVNDANIRDVVKGLATLEARGMSNHLGAVQAALVFRPDVILILTDADDLSPPALKRVIASAQKPIMMCVGQVTSEGVQRPRELK